MSAADWPHGDVETSPKSDPPPFALRNSPKSSSGLGVLCTIAEVTCTPAVVGAGVVAIGAVVLLTPAVVVWIAVVVVKNIGPEGSSTESAGRHSNTLSSLSYSHAVDALHEM